MTPTDSTGTISPEATAPGQAKLARRPQRADARRNYDALIEAARHMFHEHEQDTSLEQVAKRAGVGIGTLYRHFPNRLALLEAVYRDEVDDLAGRSAEIAETTEPMEGLVAWLHMFLSYGVTKRALFHELLEAGDDDAEIITHSRATVIDTGTAALARAQQSGEVRADVEVTDLTRLVGGCTMMPGSTPEQQQRMLEVVIAGIRA